MGRKSSEINQEYTNVCAELGDLQFRFKFSVPEKLASLEERLKELRHEANLALIEETKNAQPAK